MGGKFDRTVGTHLQQQPASKESAQARSHSACAETPSVPGHMGRVVCQSSVYAPTPMFASFASLPGHLIYEHNKNVFPLASAMRRSCGVGNGRVCDRARKQAPSGPRAGIDQAESCRSLCVDSFRVYVRFKGLWLGSRV
jgi:hypothetical protein